MFLDDGTAKAGLPPRPRKTYVCLQSCVDHVLECGILTCCIRLSIWHDTPITSHGLQFKWRHQQGCSVMMYESCSIRKSSSIVQYY